MVRARSLVVDETHSPASLWRRRRSHAFLPVLWIRRGEGDRRSRPGSAGFGYGRLHCEFQAQDIRVHHSGLGQASARWHGVPEEDLVSLQSQNRSTSTSSLSTIYEFSVKSLLVSQIDANSQATVKRWTRSLSLWSLTMITVSMRSIFWIHRGWVTGYRCFYS